MRAEKRLRLGRTAAHAEPNALTDSKAQRYRKRAGSGVPSLSSAEIDPIGMRSWMEHKDGYVAVAMQSISLFGATKTAAMKEAKHRSDRRKEGMMRKSGVR